MNCTPPDASASGRETAGYGGLSFYKGLALRTNVYIDGFNFYYRAIQGTPYKWLDLSKLAHLLLPQDDIHRIRYFTALVTARPDDPTQPQRQQTYLRALRTLPNLTIHVGHFLSNTKRRPLVYPPAGGPRTAEFWDTSEKGSDVNLASFLLVDGFEHDYEQAVVISNDSDLRLPVEMVRTKLGLRVGVLDPSKKHSFELSRAASWYRPLRQGPISASLFPDVLYDAQGQIVKPVSW